MYCIVFVFVFLRYCLISKSILLSSQVNLTADLGVGSTDIVKSSTVTPSGSGTAPPPQPDSGPSKNTKTANIGDVHYKQLC